MVIMPYTPGDENSEEDYQEKDTSMFPVLLELSINDSIEHAWIAIFYTIQSVIRRIENKDFGISESETLKTITFVKPVESIAPYGLMPTCGVLELFPSPKSTTKITIKQYDNNDETKKYLIECWNGIQNQMENDGWKFFSKEQGSFFNKTKRLHGKPGRPHSKDDVWAWEQVNTHGRPTNDVYKEWIEKIKLDPLRKNMVDTKRQFNRITKPGWRTK